LKNKKEITWLFSNELTNLKVFHSGKTWCTFNPNPFQASHFLTFYFQNNDLKRITILFNQLIEFRDSTKWKTTQNLQISTKELADPKCLIPSTACEKAAVFHPYLIILYFSHSVQINPLAKWGLSIKILCNKKKFLNVLSNCISLCDLFAMKKSLRNFFLHHFTSILPWCDSQRILLPRSCHIWMAKFTFIKGWPYPFHSPILFTINCWLPSKSIEDRGVDMLPPLPYSFPFHQLYLLSEQHEPETTSVKLNEI